MSEPTRAHANAHANADTGPGDLARMLAEHVLQYGPGLGQICSCGYAPRREVVNPESLLTQQDIHRAHLAAAIEAAGWRQVPDPGARPIGDDTFLALDAVLNAEVERRIAARTDKQPPTQPGGFMPKYVRVKAHALDQIIRTHDVNGFECRELGVAWDADGRIQESADD